jgi:hypothetical protein
MRLECAPEAAWTAALRGLGAQRPEFISIHIHMSANTIGNTGVMPFLHFGIECLVLFLILMRMAISV